MRKWKKIRPQLRDGLILCTNRNILLDLDVIKPAGLISFDFPLTLRQFALSISVFNINLFIKLDVWMTVSSKLGGFCSEKRF